jgi:hypothetical protein
MAISPKPTFGPNNLGLPVHRVELLTVLSSAGRLRAANRRGWIYSIPEL